MKRQHQEPPKKSEGKTAIELAILNGIESYNREQEQKKARAAAPSSASAGESRSREAMEEAGLKPRRKSRAKGRGTKMPAASIAASAAKEPALQGGAGAQKKAWVLSQLQQLGDRCDETAAGALIDAVVAWLNDTDWK